MNVRRTMLESSNTRTRIIEFAIQLFVTQGLQQTSMAQLSKESGMAVGTIYHHFDSKDKLIEETYLYVSELFGKALGPEEDEYQLPFKDQFKKLWLRSCKFFLDHPSYFFFKDTLNYSPLISNEIREKSRRHYQSATNMIKKGIELGHFPKENPEILEAWIYNTILTPAQLQLAGGMMISDKMLDNFSEMCWKGITVEQPYQRKP